MASVRFDDKGYEYFDNNYSLLFSSDISHNYLFDYVAKDLHHLPDLFERFITNRIDTTTFELKDYQNKDDLNEIIENIKTIHPYFAHDYKNDLKNKIASYFNQLLVHTIAKSNTDLYEYAVQRKWYIERFRHLVSPVSFVDDNYCDIYFQNFQTSVGYEEDDEDVESFILNISAQRPLGFYDEIMTQKAISNMLYFILDISAPEIGNLNISQRIWLYGNIFDNYNVTPVISTTQNLGFMPSIRSRKDQGHSQKTVYSGEVYDIFEPLRALSSFNVVRDGIPADMAEYLSSAIKYADDFAEVKIYEEYEVSHLRELLYLEIVSMIRSGTMIKKCRNCGKYFIISNRKTAYCNRITESGLPCSTIGPTLSFQRKMENEEALKLYTRAYKTHFARTKSTKKKKMTTDELKSWTAAANEKLEKVRAGELSLSDFQDWLKK